MSAPVAAVPPATAPPPAASLNLTNIQGDVILGLPKKVEEFVFLQITDPVLLKKQMHEVTPLITTMAQVIADRDRIEQHKKENCHGPHPPPLLSIVGMNIAFSQFGLTKLGITDDLGDPLFKSGQQVDSSAINDKGTTDASGKFTPAWEVNFKKEIHLVYIITGESWDSVNKRRHAMDGILHNCTKIVTVERGNVRPGPEKGHEHFGFQDGISNPAILNFDLHPFKGQESVHSGVILLGNDGDTAQRPTWAKDGSFLVFRKLKQLVPEFNAFLLKNGTFDGLTPQQGADFLGARLVGRWKSGAPIDITPVQDDPVLAKDPNRNNDFHYIFQNPDDQVDQTRCPFSAHVRKTNPRGDLDKFGGTEKKRIMRQGIPYGPEVTDSEKQTHATKEERGLLFACYQSVIANGFHFIQSSWANNPTFPIGKNVPIGFDPIIGQSNDANRSRSTAGFDPKAQAKPLTLDTEFVVTRGGEYFFSPSLSALKSIFTAKDH